MQKLLDGAHPYSADKLANPDCLDCNGTGEIEVHRTEGRAYKVRCNAPDCAEDHWRQQLQVWERRRDAYAAREALVTGVYSGRASPNPDCKVCHGAGWVHNNLPSGLPDWGATHFCSAEGCMTDSQKALNEGRPFNRDTRGIVRRAYEVTHERANTQAGERILSRSQTFESFVPRPGSETLVKAAHELAGGHGMLWLAIIGQKGNGKTHIAQAICHASRERGVPARYYSVPDLFSAMRQRDLKDKEVLLDDVGRTPDLVVLDQFESWSTAAEQADMEQLVDLRYSVPLPTVFVTDVALSGWKSERIRNRVEDLHICRIVMNTAACYRTGGR